MRVVIEMHNGLVDYIYADAPGVEVVILDDPDFADEEDLAEFEGRKVLPRRFDATYEPEEVAKVAEAIGP